MGLADVSVFLGNGNGTFRAAGNFAVGVGPACAALEDLSGEGQPDLVTANLGTDSVAVLPGK